MKIAKVRDVKTPTRGTSKSAGLDFYVPNGYNFGPLAPNESILVPSGIHVNIPEGFCLIALNKSGVALKKGLQVGACLIDEDYQGEIQIHLTNLSGEGQYIESGEKIVQFVMVPVSLCGVELTELDTLYDSVTERGTGGFGSTNKKHNVL